MKNPNLFLSVVLSLCFSVAHADLSQSLIQELNKPDQGKWQTLSSKLSNYHIVFGQLAEQEKAGVIAFSDHMRTIEQDLKGIQPSLVTTPLYAPYETNAELLHMQLKTIYEQNGKLPLILIGNPGTGPEFLYTALKYPDLVESGIIARIVLIMPVFGIPIFKDRQEWLSDTASCENTLFELPCSGIDKILNGKFSKLDPSGSRLIFENLILDGATINVAGPGEPSITLTQKLSKMVYYVRGGVKSYRYTPTGLTTRTHVPKKILPYYLINEKKGEVTDGMTYVENQLLRDESQETETGTSPLFGTDLTANGPLNVSHWDLFVANFVNTPSTLRTAFTRALLSEILDVQ